MRDTDEILARAGLEPITGKYPRVTLEGDQLWLKVWDETAGRDIVCEIGVRRAFILLIELALALARVVPR